MRRGGGSGPGGGGGRRRSLLVGAVVAVALLAGAAPSAGTGGRPADGQWQANPPDQLGPYAVGLRTLTMVDPAREGRTLPVDVLYPVDRPDAAGRPAAEYDLLLARLASEVAVTGAPVSDDGPFPLVVFSHGSGGVRYQSYFLTEVLASHGFVVAAPDHVGNTAVDLLLGTPAPFERSAVDRPLDVSFVIDQLLVRSGGRRNLLAGAVDGERIGVTGHSFGGYTALASATESVAGPGDDRVDAIAPLAPAARALTDEALADIDVPLLVVGGTLDDTTPVDPNSVRSFGLPEVNRRFRVDVEGAGHASFTNACDFYDTLEPVAPPEVLAFLEGNRDDACGPGLVDVAEAQRITNYYVVAFFRRFLGARPGYSNYLRARPAPLEGAPDVVLFSREDEGRACASVAGGPRCR